MLYMGLAHAVEIMVVGSLQHDETAEPSVLTSDDRCRIVSDAKKYLEDMATDAKLNVDGGLMAYQAGEILIMLF